MGDKKSKISFGLFLIFVVGFFAVYDISLADIGPVDKNSQDIEHYRDDDKDKKKDKEKSVDLSKDKYTPTSLRVVHYSDAEVVLNWDENAKREDGYDIQRRIDGGNWRIIGRAGRNASMYRDLTVASGTKYYYRVRAFNRDKVTKWSNIAGVKTKGISPKEKIELEKKEALKEQEQKLKAEFEMKLKQEIENVKKEFLSHRDVKCSLENVDPKEIDKAFTKRCEELTGKKIDTSDDSGSVEKIINNVWYSNNKIKLIFAGFLLFVVINNAIWHIKHKTVKNKLEGEY